MKFPSRIASLVGIALPFVMARSAQAQTVPSLTTTVSYQSQCFVQTCIPPTTYPGSLQSTTNTNATVSVGDSYGDASGQSDYGLLSASGSGVWIGGQQPAVISEGITNNQFVDGITLLGGTGKVYVQMIMNLNGVFSPGASNPFDNGDGNISASIYINDSSTVINHTSGNTNGFDVRSNADRYGGIGTWTSSDGTFYPGNYPGSGFSPSGVISLSGFFDYNMPFTIIGNLHVAGAKSFASSAIASVFLLVPEGTSIVSFSGHDYAAAPVPEPSEVFGLLIFGGCLVGVKLRHLRRAA